MSVDQQARSEVREKYWKELSLEQKKIGMSSLLELKPSSEDHGTIITGKVIMDGVSHDIEINHPNIASEGDVAKIDGEMVDPDTANELFKFYYPIARVQFESNNFPTPETDVAYKVRLKKKLLGQ